jgi:NAD(P)-dependent dehydrogenase (short-subunit alcohol dehydrogenase family)
LNGGFEGKGKNMCKLLEGKVCVITGGGQAVGLGIAQEFVEQGATVVVTGRRQATLTKRPRRWDQ